MPADLASLQDPGAKKQRRKALLTVLFVSLGIHLLGGFGAAVWVVARYFNPPAATFVAKKDPTRLAAQERTARQSHVITDEIERLDRLFEDR